MFIFFYIKFYYVLIDIETMLCYVIIENMTELFANIKANMQKYLLIYNKICHKYTFLLNIIDREKHNANRYYYAFWEIDR